MAREEGKGFVCLASDGDDDDDFAGRVVDDIPPPFDGDVDSSRRCGRRWAASAGCKLRPALIFVISLFAGVLCISFFWLKENHHRRRRERDGLIDLSQLEFKMVHTGTCVSHGFQPVNDLFFCEAAAMNLGLADSSAVLTNFPGVPEGCYYFADKEEGIKGLWLGTNPKNVGTGAQVEPGGQVRRPLCSITSQKSRRSRVRHSVTEESGQRKQTFHLGDEVRMRDHENDRWEYGTVTKVHPVMAKPHNWRRSFSWNSMEFADKEEREHHARNSRKTTHTANHVSGSVSPPKANLEQTASERKAELNEEVEEDEQHWAEKHLEADLEERVGGIESAHDRNDGRHVNDNVDQVHVLSPEVEPTAIVADVVGQLPSDQAEIPQSRSISQQGVENIIIKGISYAPVPTKQPKRLDNDDFMMDEMEALWGKTGRGDLQLIKSLGANTVRLYGNDPTKNHKRFLDEALDLGLSVITGFSDYPYIQMSGNCITTHFSCFKQIKKQHERNLKSGFLVSTAEGHPSYHRGLRILNVMNEPDLKLLPLSNPKHFSKGLLSAFDAVLEVEKEAGLDPRNSGTYLPNITVTFSFGVCPACHDFGKVQPALGQMWELRQAMRDPSSVGYEARNDLWSAYKSRFTNSFNTANPATDVHPLFLDTYDEVFAGTPVFIGEYHSPSKVDQLKDLEAIARIARDPRNHLIGFSFFEFQVRYDKGGSELMFGMFGLGERIRGTVRIGEGDFNVRCLTPLMPPVERRAPATERSCGLIEPGFAYHIPAKHGGWKSHVKHVSTASDCCKRCKSVLRCQAWTWNHGQTKTCDLHGREPSDALDSRRAEAAAVSGLPPPRDMIWKQHTVESALDGQASRLIPESIVSVFGGDGVDYTKLCKASKLSFFMYA